MVQSIKCPKCVNNITLTNRAYPGDRPTMMYVCSKCDYVADENGYEVR